MPGTIKTAALCVALVGTLAAWHDADAKLTEQDILALQLDGFHLGMTRSEVDRAIASRTDITEPYVSALDSFDCNALLPKAGRIAGSYPFVAPGNLAFEDAGGRGYVFNFARRPDEGTVERISYTERRGIGSWQDYLGELEARFGKPDLVGQDRDGRDVALWCSEARDCVISGNTPRKPLLSVRLFPNTPDAVEPGDRLRFALFEGRDRSDGRRRAYGELPKTDPKLARRLSEQCLGHTGKFSTQTEADDHYLRLMNMGRRAGPVIRQPFDIPAPVFAGLGIDRDRMFAPGVCFNSGDVILMGPGCNSVTFGGLRWARRIGDLWLVSLKFGGVSLRREYFAVRKEHGLYRKVWWADDLTGFNAWRADGAIAMVEPPRKR
jgi:hypothetical protein